MSAQLQALRAALATHSRKRPVVREGVVITRCGELRADGWYDPSDGEAYVLEITGGPTPLVVSGPTPRQACDRLRAFACSQSYAELNKLFKF